MLPHRDLALVQRQTTAGFRLLLWSSVKDCHLVAVVASCGWWRRLDLFMSCRQDRLVYRRVKNFFSFADFLLITSGNVKIIFPINSLSVRPVSLLFVTKQRWPVHSFKFHLHSCKMSFEIYLGRPSPAEAQLGGKVKDLLLTKVNMKGFIYFYFIFFTTPTLPVNLWHKVQRWPCRQYHSRQSASASLWQD